MEGAEHSGRPGSASAGQGSSDSAAVLLLAFPLLLFGTAVSLLLVGERKPGPKRSRHSNGSFAEYSWRMAFRFCYLMLRF